MSNNDNNDNTYYPTQHVEFAERKYEFPSPSGTGYDEGTRHAGYDRKAYTGPSQVPAPRGGNRPVKDNSVRRSSKGHQDTTTHKVTRRRGNDEIYEEIEPDSRKRDYRARGNREREHRRSDSIPQQRAHNFRPRSPSGPSSDNPFLKPGVSSPGRYNPTVFEQGSTQWPTMNSASTFQRDSPYPEYYGSDLPESPLHFDTRTSAADSSSFRHVGPNGTRARPAPPGRQYVQNRGERYDRQNRSRDDPGFVYEEEYSTSPEDIKCDSSFVYEKEYSSSPEDIRYNPPPQSSSHRAPRASNPRSSPPVTNPYRTPRARSPHLPGVSYVSGAQRPSRNRERERDSSPNRPRDDSNPASTEPSPKTSISSEYYPTDRAPYDIWEPDDSVADSTIPPHVPSPP